MVNGLPATWLVGALGEVAQAISRIAPHGSVRVAKGGHVKLRTLMATLAIAVLSTGVAFADGKVEVKPKEFDPGRPSSFRRTGSTALAVPPARTSRCRTPTSPG